MRNLTIAPIGIGEMLINGEFIVPTYQRSFAWTEDQVRNLLTDISGAMKRVTDGKGDMHFLGTIVVIERPRQKAVEIVDGQQRLATASILLSAIRDFHFAIGREPAAASYDAYLRTLHVPTGKYNPRLRMNENDDHFFRKTIVELPSKRQKYEPATQSHKRISEAYEYATGFVKNIADTYSAKDAIEVLFNMTEFIRSRALAIRVIVDDESDAYTVFETMNDRHLYLTVADLLKNFLFGTSGSQIEIAKTNWHTMEGKLATLKSKKDRTVDFIRQQWVSMHGLVREKDLFRDIKAKITEEESAADLAVVLAEQSEKYVAVLDPKNEMWDAYGTAVRKALTTFESLRVERLRPLLLAILSKFSVEEGRKAIVFLRSAAVRIIATTGINGSIEEKLFETAVAVYTRKIPKTTKLVLAMSDFVPNDDVFKATFGTMSVTKAALARFYLHEIEDWATSRDENDPTIGDRDEEKITLEHIIPVSAEERTSNWPELSSDLGGAIYKRLGNQTLMPKKMNNALNGKPFKEKRLVYEECHRLHLTKAIAKEYSVFGENEVNDRQRKLAEYALKVWPLKQPPKRGGR